VDVYFTSPETNEVWLKLALADDQGNVLGETGVIKPGQYVKQLTLGELPDADISVKMKIIAFEPETYVSMGTVPLHTTLKIVRNEDADAA